jgi:hypothetical protein
MNKKAAAALTLILASVLAGCTAGTQAQERQASGAESTHGSPENVEQGTAQSYLDEVRPIVEEHFEQAEADARDAQEKLEEIRPPEELRPVHEKLVSAYREVLPAYHHIAEAASGGDEDRLNAAVQEHLPEIEEFNAEVLSALRELQRAAAASEEGGTPEKGVAAGGGIEREQGRSAEAGDFAAREITLRIEGSPGTRFSGTCAVGNEEHAIGGQVPREFGYNLDGQELNCEVRKQSAGAGTLEVLLLAGSNVRSVQQTNAPGGTVNLTYASNGVSSSTNTTSRVSQSSKVSSSTGPR